MDNLESVANTSERNFKALFREIPIPSYIWQKVKNDLILIDYNLAAEEITEGWIKNCLGIKASKMYKDQPEILKELNRCANNQVNNMREIKYNLKKTREQRILLVKNLFLPPNLVLVHIEDKTKLKQAEEKLKEFSRNITERKQAEEELRKAKTFSESIIDSLPGIFYFFNDVGKFLRWNKNFEEVSEYSTEEISKMSMLEFFMGEDKKIMAERIQEVFDEGKSTAEASFMSKSGISYPYYFTGLRIMIGNTPYLGGMGIDIAERKQAEEELRNAKTFSESIIDSLPGIFYFFDEEGKFLRWNRNFEEVSEYSSEEISRMSMLKFFMGEDKKLMAERIQEVFDEGRSTAEANFISKSGKKYPYFFTGLRIMIGKTPYLGGMGIDITERKQAEEELRKAKTFSESIIDSLPGMFYFFDDEGKFLRWNKNFEEVSGYSSEEISRMSMLEFFMGGDKKLMAERIQEVFDEGESTAEASFISKSGKKYPYFFTGLRIMIGNTPYLGGMGIDIAERKQAEKACRDSEEKYREAYNRANFYKDIFAHDMNNILQNIQLSVELLSLSQKDLEIRQNIDNLINIAKNQINRGARLILTVRRLSEIEESEITVKSIEICEVLRKTIQYITNSFQDREINVQVDTIGREFYIKANELLSDVFENILINAVKHNDNPIVEILIKISRYQKKNIKYIKLEFVDNGIGIPDKLKEKVLLRANKTDDDSTGMGLGLSLVKKIIEKYNGKIWIENKVEGNYAKGSNFILLIPEEY